MSVIPGFQDAIRSPMASSRRFRRCTIAASFAAVLAMGGCAHQPTIVGGLTATQIAMLKEDDFVQNDDGWNLNLSAKLLFGTDADSISSASTTYITKMAQSLRSVGLERVIVMGYTDSDGSDAHNLALSERRAEAVASAMMASGMLQQNIQIVPMGKQRPIADNRTAAGRAQNRRVVIVVPAK